MSEERSEKKTPPPTLSFMQIMDKAGKVRFFTHLDLCIFNDEAFVGPCKYGPKASAKLALLR